MKAGRLFDQRFSLRRELGEILFEDSQAPEREVLLAGRDLGRDALGQLPRDGLSHRLTGIGIVGSAACDLSQLGAAPVA